MRRYELKWNDAFGNARQCAIDLASLIVVGEVTSVDNDATAGWTYGFDLYFRGSPQPFWIHGVGHPKGVVACEEKQAQLRQGMLELRAELIKVWEAA